MTRLPLTTALLFLLIGPMGVIDYIEWRMM